MNASVIKTFKFSAAHRLPDDPGPCRRVHGHTYTLDVLAYGPVDEHGMVVHFDRLKEAWTRIEPMLDHQMLNESLPGDAQPPTTELVAVWLLRRLHDQVPQVRAVTLHEGPGSRARVHLEDL